MPVSWTSCEGASVWMWTWTDLVPESLPGTPGLWGEAASPGGSSGGGPSLLQGDPIGCFLGADASYLSQ